MISFTNLFIYFSFLIIQTNIFNVFSSDTQCPFAPSNPLDRRTDKTKLRLVQYNVEWMFYDEYSGCPGSSCVWANQTEVLIHMDYISTIINDLKPDIVNFCEIEGCDEINMIINKTNPLFNPYLIKGTDSSTGQNVGMMTLLDPTINLYRTEIKFNYPIPDSKCGWNISGSTGISKHFITKFKFTPDLDIMMISTHLLAMPTDSERCSKREAQSQVLQEQIVNLIGEGNEVILIGDLNDWDNLILDTNNNLPISQVLDILKGNTGLYAGKFELKSIGNKISKSERYSEYWDANGNCQVEPGEFSMLDHILLTPKLYDLVTNAFAYHIYPHSCDGDSYNSDHDPVVIDFQL